MAIRLTGMSSGLDTEALVSELVSAYKKKGEKYQKAQTTLSWKQDAWKSLNTKIHSFYKSAGNLRFSSGYITKKVTLSDAAKATVTASNSAMNGTQKLSILQTASAGYLTGGQLNNASANTKLSELGFSGTGDEAGTVKLSGNGKTKELKLDKNTTVQDFIKQINDSGTGVTASFDATTKRIFMSTKNTGKDADFTLIGTDEKGTEALDLLKVNASNSKTSIAEAEKWLKYTAASTDSNGNLTVDTSGIKDALMTIAKSKSEIAALNSENSSITSVRDGYANDKSYVDAAIANRKADALKDELSISDADWTSLKQLSSKSISDLKKDYVVAADGSITEATDEDKADAANTIVKGTTYLVELAHRYNLTVPNDDDDGDTLNLSSESFTLIKKYDENVNKMSEYTGSADITNKTDDELAAMSEQYAQSIEQENDKIAANNKKIAEYNQTIADNAVLDSNLITKDLYSVDENGTESIDLTSDADVAAYVTALETKAEYMAKTYEQTTDGSGNTVTKARAEGTGAVKVDASDAVIKLNNAEYTSNNNTFNINGLTIQAQAVTNGDITITTANDTQGMYNKIKDFLDSYNTLVNEMTSLYNADSAKGYEPLTEDEKDAMSDKEIEKWEEKIKSALLRRDTTLDGVLNTMTSAMSSAVTVNGKRYSLASLGIHTSGYFSSEKNKQNAYHIDGDSDDESVSGNTDKLMAMLNSDPDTAIEIFKQITSKLYDNLDKKMRSTTMSSAYTVYNDKEMAKNYSNYTTTIKQWDEKVTSIEDKYYKKFAAMEKAMSQLQSQTQNLSGLFGS